MNRNAVTVLAFVVLGVMVPACATNPVTGRRELSLLSPQQELQMGLEGYQAITQEYGLYEDPALQAYVDSVGQRVARVSHLPSLTWHFTVIDDPSVNAFAMPGGYIYITRGILAHLNSEAQLAGVLGHEIGHVTHRHTAEQLTQQQLYGLGLGVVTALSETMRRYNDLAQQALGLLFLKYGRTDETEADELGVDYAARAGYDPREIPATYAMLKRIGEQSGQRLPAFLSTHPDPGDREERTASLAKQAAQGKTGLLVNGRSYVQRLDGVTFGNDPRQGYFTGDQYVQPAMGFQVAFPAGWRHQDSRTAVVAQEPGKQAMMQFSLADAGTLAPGDYVQQLVARGRVASAEGSPETIGGFAAWVGRVALPQQQGAAVPAAAGFIRRSEKLMFQVLGRSQAPGDANETRIFESLRSFRVVTDRSRLDVQPDRVKVAKVGATASLEEALAKLGAASSYLEADAIMNNVEAGETVRAGTLIKFVALGKR
jgi:predicted Zn-dependent protease